MRFVKEGIRDKVVLMIGGAPVTQEYADSIGADGYAPDSAAAVDKAKELLGLEVKSLTVRGRGLRARGRVARRFGLCL